MRTQTIAILAFTCLTEPAIGHETMTFTVSGYGKVFYEANMCDMVVGVVTEDEDVLECRSRHEKTLDAIAAHVNQLDSDEVVFGTIATDLSIRDRSSRELGDEIFRYQTLFSIRLKELERLSRMQSELVGLGVNRIFDVKLLSDELPDLIDRARKQAIADARDKARLAASELNWTLGSAVAIAFNEDPWSRARLSTTYGARSSMDGGQMPDTSAAEVYVDATVTITFRFSLD
jgi:hypothetical protein